MNDTSSFFIEDKALFGCYPSQEDVNDLEKKGVRYFVDLTYVGEKKIKKYITQHNFIQFPIKDHNIPEELYKFSIFICKISNIIKKLNKGEYVYIHCKGGHGRAGLVVSCLLCYIHKITSHDSLKLTNEFHNNRKIMNDKWRHIGSPQTDKQKNFVIRLFKPVYLNHIYNKNTYFSLNNNSKHIIVYNDIIYKNINICYYCHKYPESVKEIKNCKTFYDLKKIIRNKINDIYVDNPDILQKIINYKFNTYVDVRNIIIKTLIRPIVYKEDNKDIGIIYETIRSNFLLAL